MRPDQCGCSLSLRCFLARPFDRGVFDARGPLAPSLSLSAYEGAFAVLCLAERRLSPPTGLLDWVWLLTGRGRVAAVPLPLLEVRDVAVADTGVLGTAATDRLVSFKIRGEVGREFCRVEADADASDIIPSVPCPFAEVAPSFSSASSPASLSSDSELSEEVGETGRARG